MAIGNVQRWGNSQGVRIPKSLLETANLKENDEVEIIAEGEQITIRKARHIANLDALFAGYTGNYRPGEDEAGEPIGREVW